VFSNTGVLALRAVLVIAMWPEDGAASTGAIAARLGAPSNYLSKVLNRLTRLGVLRSTRGPGGGYRLLRAPEELSIWDIVAEFERPRRSDVCLLGGPCDTDNPCVAHRQWREMRDRTSTLYDTTTIADFMTDARTNEPLRRTS